MSTDGGIYLSVSAKCGPKTLGKKIVKVDRKGIVGDICQHIDIGDFEALSARVGASETESDMMDVTLDTPIEVVSSFNAKYVVFSLIDNENRPKSRANGNAFQKLMDSRKKLVLPQRKPDTRNDYKIYNDVLDIMDKQGLGFSLEVVQSMGEKIVKTLAAAIFHMESHFDKMSSRSIHIPDLFKQFNNYVDHKANHKAQPRIDASLLKTHVDALSELLLLPWMASMWMATNVKKMKK